jgi:hypothetical protein
LGYLLEAHENLVYLLRPLALAQSVVSLVSCYEPYEPPSADLCLQIANEIYEISLDEALRDPKVWSDYGYENETPMRMILETQFWLEIANNVDRANYLSGKSVLKRGETS